MKDMITKGTGNSRFLKSSIPGGTTWDQALTMLRSGTFPIDLNGLNSAGIIQQGSAYSKVNVLPDDVCTALGLDPTAAEPKDAFGVVANPAELWVWEKMTHTPERYEVGDVMSDVCICGAADSNSAGTTWIFADSISVNKQGFVTLNNPTTDIYVGYNKYYNPSSLAGKYGYSMYPYFISSRLTAGLIYYFPNDCKFTRGTNIDGFSYAIGASKIQPVLGISEAYSHITYLVSPNSQAYPDGISGGYYYKLLGQIGDGMTKIETGSYVGTNTSGQDNPNSLTFGFAPKLVFIIGDKDTPEKLIFYCYAMTDEFTVYKTSLGSSGVSYAKLSGNTMSWYNTTSYPAQLNDRRVYQYIAIG